MLIGDSGEKDVEIYERVRSSKPLQIIKVFIRHASLDKSPINAVKVAEVAKKAFMKSNGNLDGFRWRLFDNPCDILDDKYWNSCH